VLPVQAVAVVAAVQSELLVVALLRVHSATATAAQLLALVVLRSVVSAAATVTMVNYALASSSVQTLLLPLQVHVFSW
jgi:hypothetical protein